MNIFQTLPPHINGWTLDIRVRFAKSVKFHNGEKFDADDVVFTMNYMGNPDNGAKPARNVNWWENAEKLGEYKVRLNLKKEFPAALEFLSGPLVIYPNEYYAKVGPEVWPSNPLEPAHTL